MNDIKNKKINNKKFKKNIKNNYYEKMDDNLIMNQLFDYINYNDLKELSKTNKNNHILFKKSLKNNKIKKIMIGSIYRPKLWSEFQQILNSLDPPENLEEPPDMIQIIDYSNTKNTIRYKYVPVGTYKNIFYPILDEKIKLLSFQIKYPQFVTPLVEDIDKFYEKWEKIENNSHIVYSIKYIHPLLKYSLYKMTNFLAFTLLFFLGYIIFVFFFILMKNNFMVKDEVSLTNLSSHFDMKDNILNSNKNYYKNIILIDNRINLYSFDLINYQKSKNTNYIYFDDELSMINLYDYHDHDYNHYCNLNYSIKNN